MERARYKRNPHPGVQIKKRTWKSGLSTFIARFTEPDSGLVQELSLTKLGLTTPEARRDWAIVKSRAILVRLAQLESGAPLRTETKIEEAIKEYVQMKRAELRSSTLAVYLRSIERLKAWAKNLGLEHTEDIAPKHLAQLRRIILIADKQVALAGGRKGQYKAGGIPRSPHSVNKDLRALRTLLNWWRRNGITPLLSSDSIADVLAFQYPGKPAIVFLNKDAIANLLLAALRHDAACFKETRTEHLSGCLKGLTARYQAITPLISYLLLTGCRADEGFALKWSDWNERERMIELKDVDRIKTKHARNIDLMITPYLERLLAALKGAAEGEFVFGGNRAMPKSLAYSTRRRLISEFNAPKFTWQQLRKTCGTFLTCAPGIYGGASAWHSAKRLGHSVEVAEKHYAGLIRSAPQEAKTLEAAMEIESLMEAVCTVQNGTPIDQALAAGAAATRRGPPPFVLPTIVVR